MDTDTDTDTDTGTGSDTHTDTGTDTDTDTDIKTKNIYTHAKNLTKIQSKTNTLYTQKSEDHTPEQIFMSGLRHAIITKNLTRPKILHAKIDKIFCQLLHARLSIVAKTYTNKQNIHKQTKHTPTNKPNHDQKSCTQQLTKHTPTNKPMSGRTHGEHIMLRLNLG